MAAEKSPKEPRQSLLPLPVLIVILFAIIGGAGLIWLMRSGAGRQESMELTPEAKAYARHLQLADVEMKATETYLGQTIVEITGNITNAGDRPLRRVDLNCVFYDIYGQVVLRQRVSIVRSRDGVLNPGETREFRLPFDELPASWNNSMPQLVIAGIVF